MCSFFDGWIGSVQMAAMGVSLGKMESVEEGESSRKDEMSKIIMKEMTTRLCSVVHCSLSHTGWGINIETFILQLLFQYGISQVM